MIMRICPSCDQKWFSTNHLGDWTCKCGRVLESKLNREIEVSSDEGFQIRLTAKPTCWEGR